jgi:diguanylate cyclase (GGDEF)-like protein/PAS domain S-box-containing protein
MINTFSLSTRNCLCCRWILIALLCSLIAFGVTYITWNQYLEKANQAAIGLVLSASQFLSSNLSASGVSTLDNVESLQQLEDSLTRFSQQDNGIERAYLYTAIGGEIIHLAESQTLGDSWSNIIATPTLVSEPQLTRLTDFVSVLIPIKNLQTEETIAVLRADFQTNELYKEAVMHATHALLVVVSVTLLLVSCYWLKKKNRELEKNERSRSALLSQLPGMAYRCKNDKDWTMLFVSDGCHDLTGYLPESLLLNRDLSYKDMISPEHRTTLRGEWERVLTTRTQFRAEYQIVTATGEEKWVLEMGQGVYDQQGEVGALEGLIIDITEQRICGEKIQYMHDHDLLTGLHNRRFYERAKQQMAADQSLLPLSIVIADINSLKMVNGAFGYKAGDQLLSETASILRACLQTTGIAARTGGNEFRMLLPNVTGEMAQEIAERILSSCAAHNENSSESFSINISLALGTAENGDRTIDEVESEAEQTLRQRKLINRANPHSTMLSSIMAALYACSQETEEHSRRLATLSTMVGRNLGLPRKSLDELELLALLHDVGKVGIDDRVLNKQGKLNEEEWTLMKKHPKIGYRIAMSSSALESIAPYILTHHERWDGTGYPQGLQGEEVPLLSRILAVVDAYDAMTEDRIYRQAMDKQSALAEIERNAGTQFDPQIVDIFVQNMKASNKL